ncbi:MAG: signal peptidase I [Patescibacteria group bacterium]
MEPEKLSVPEAPKPTQNSASIVASHPEPKSSNKFHNSLWEVVKFVILTVIIVVPIRTFIAQPFIVHGGSMESTFLENEYLIVDELSYLFRSPTRGEVIVFRYPKNPSTFFIKRIVGLPGETIAIKNNRILIKQADQTWQALNEPYAQGKTFSDITDITLKADEYFVVGDNRQLSYDSRAWGPVKIDLIRGRAWLRLLPLSRINYLPGRAPAQNQP